jgi:3-isopropylmalate dehydrogenase
MMLDFLGEREAAEAVEKSIAFVTGQKLESMAAGKMGYSTSEVGDLVVENL